MNKALQPAILTGILRNRRVLNMVWASILLICFGSSCNFEFEVKAKEHVESFPDTIEPVNRQPQNKFARLMDVHRFGGSIDIDGDGIDDVVVELLDDGKHTSRFEEGHIVERITETYDEKRTEVYRDNRWILKELETYVDESEELVTYTFIDSYLTGQFDVRKVKKRHNGGFCLRIEHLEPSEGWILMSDYCTDAQRSSLAKSDSCESVEKFKRPSCVREWIYGKDYIMREFTVPGISNVTFEFPQGSINGPANGACRVKSSREGDAEAVDFKFYDTGPDVGFFREIVSNIQRSWEDGLSCLWNINPKLVNDIVSKIGSNSKNKVRDKVYNARIRIACNTRHCQDSGSFEEEVNHRGLFTPTIRVRRGLTGKALSDTMLHEIIHFAVDHDKENGANIFRPEEGAGVDKVYACGAFCGTCGPSEYCLKTHPEASSYERTASACSRCADDAHQYICGMKLGWNMSHSGVPEVVPKKDHPVVYSFHEKKFRRPEPLGCGTFSRVWSSESISNCFRDSLLSPELCHQLDVFTPYTCDDYYFNLSDLNYTEWIPGCVYCGFDKPDRSAFCTDYMAEADWDSNSCANPSINGNVLFAMCGQKFEQ